MRRHRRHVRVPPDLTSLFDVLFIVIFAVLIRGAALQQAAAKAATPPEPVPQRPDPQPASALKTQALAQLDAELAARPTVIARISKAGTLTMLEAGEKHTPLDVPLLEHSPDPDIAMMYLGDRSAELRLCRLVALHLQIADLANHLVIIAPEARSADLSHALYTGLRRDVERCQSEQRGLAVVVEPEAAERGSAAP